jgi:hypothetical protein
MGAREWVEICARDPVPPLAFTGAGALRPQLKGLSRETREALLLALLEDAPQDMQCDLLDCEYHDHSRCVGLCTPPHASAPRSSLL